jgi:hypothetical protein
MRIQHWASSNQIIFSALVPALLALSKHSAARSLSGSFSDIRAFCRKNLSKVLQRLTVATYHRSENVGIEPIVVPDLKPVDSVTFVLRGQSGRGLNGS